MATKKDLLSMYRTSKALLKCVERMEKLCEDRDSSLAKDAEKIRQISLRLSRAASLGEAGRAFAQALRESRETV